MARQTKPAGRQKPQQRNTAAPRQAAPATTSAAAALDWPLSPFKYLAPWFERMQRINEHAMQGLSADAALGREDLRSAESPNELLGYQMEFAASQFARWALINEEFMAGMLDMHALWMRDAEALAAKQMRGWLGAEARKPLGSAEAILGFQEAATPADLMSAMQRAQTEIGKAWLHTLRHDLQTHLPVQ